MPLLAPVLEDRVRVSPGWIETDLVGQLEAACNGQEGVHGVPVLSQDVE
jgi:hypothetical protein